MLLGAFLSIAHGQDHHVEVIDHYPTIHKWAIPSYNHYHIGYWVGGGALSRKKGHAPAFDEGTWGWDYRGWLIHRRVDLLWWHGRRYQGGSGAYRTDGPHLPHLPHAEGHGESHGEGHGESHGEGHGEGHGQGHSKGHEKH